MLSKKQVSDICCGDGTSKQCRFLDVADDGSYQCLKLRTDERKKIDQKVKDFLAQCRRKNIDPYQQGAPLGDNCPGLPILKNIEVGIK